MLISGSCICGEVKYKIDGKPIVVAHCHCLECQKRSGAGHTTGVMIHEKNFTINGNLSEFSRESEVGKETTHYFCSNCGSPLFGKNTKMTGFVTVSAGTLEDPNSIEPQVVVFAKYRNHWDLMDNSLETYQDMPDWKPDTDL